MSGRRGTPAPHGRGAGVPQGMRERAVTDMIAPVGPAAPSIHAGMAQPVRAAGAERDALVVRVQAGLDRARELGAEAARAASAAPAGIRADVEGVMIATRKADAAFLLLDAVRTAMVEAYAREEQSRA